VKRRSFLLFLSSLSAGGMLAAILGKLPLDKKRDRAPRIRLKKLSNSDIYSKHDLAG